MAAQAHAGPVCRTWALRLALGYLASRAPEGHHAMAWAFGTFWRSLKDSRPQERWSTMNAALNGIYLAVDRRRDLSVVSDFERAAQGRTE